MNMKRTLALLLTVVMLVTALPLGVFAADETAAATDTSTSTESTAYESSDYYWKLNFNKATVSSTKTKAFTEGKTDSTYNPYSFSGGTDNLSGYVKKRADGDNYFAVEYAVNSTDGNWAGAQIEVGKDGMPASIFNTVSFEMDFRWQGLPDDTGEYIYAIETFDLLRYRRYGNFTASFIQAKINDAQNLELYLRSASSSANYLCTLQKGATDFTNIKVVYYDVSQTFSLYIDKEPIAEGIVVSGTYDFRDDDYVISTYDKVDFFNTSRVDKLHSTSAYHYVAFEMMRVTYGNEKVGNEFTLSDGTTAYTGMPLKYDIDNLFIKNADIADGITPYYENTFDRDFVGLVDKVGGKATYTYANSSTISKGTYNGNSYVNVEPSGRFNLKDVYQYAQEGNYVVEFDARATSAGDNRFLVLHTGSDTKNILTVDANGYIKLYGKSTGVQITAHKDAEGNLINQDTWTHIALSVTVDKGGSNANRVEDFRLKSAGNSLRYQFALFIDGALVAVYSDLPRLEYLQSSDSSGNKFKFIDDRNFTKKAVTEEPSADTLATYTKLDYERTVDTDDKAYYYYDSATGDIYQLQYDETGAFVPGTVSSGVGTGSLWLDVTGCSHDDVIGFFNNSTSTSGAISGAIDNLKIYSGVIPLQWASTPSATTGVISEIDFTKLTTTTTGNVMMNYKGGDVGVTLLSSWISSRVTQNTGYATYTMTSAGEVYFDSFTQYMGGKVFSVEAKVRNFVPTKDMSVFEIRRQAAGGSSTSSHILYTTTAGDLYYTTGSVNYFLCDKDGNRYNIGGETWMIPEVIVDETGTEALLTYLVNGEVAYCIPEGADEGYVPYMAALVEGVISSNVFNLRTAIDQRARYFHTCSSSTDPKYFCADVQYVKAEYTTLPEIVQQAQGYYDVEANEFGGGLFSAEISLKNFDKTYDVALLAPRRQVSASTPAYTFETLYAEASTGYLYFEHDNGYKHYLVNEHRERYSVKGSTAVTPKVIFDDSGDKMLVTFLVDGAVAYYDNGEKLVSASNLYIGGDVVHELADGAVRNIRFYQIPVGEQASFADTSTAKLATVTTVPEAAEITWADELRVDFSKYATIDEFLADYDGQIEIVGDVTIENGLLKIPSGGSIKWVDYNGNLTSYLDYDRGAVNGQRLNGFTIEFVGNTDASANRSLIKLDRGALVGDGLIWVSGGALKLTGNTIQNYPLNPVGSDKFNSISATYTTQSNEVNVFADGYLLGPARSTNFTSTTYASEKVAKICITGETELKELRIHRDLEREFAKESGEIFKLDADKMEIKQGDGETRPNVYRWVRPGVMEGGLLTNALVMTHETYTNAETSESFKYFKVAPTTALTGHNFSEIWLNGYLEDMVTVFEYDFRFTPGEGVTSDVEMAVLRRAEDNSTEGLWHYLFKLTPEANYKMINNIILCDEAGTALVASAEDWNKLAIIYDADAGLVSYVLDGKIPYYTDGEELKLAQNIQLPSSRYYRMDAAETKLRTLSMFAGSTHRVDLAKLNIYTVDTDANAGYVGAQIDTADSNIRLVGGTDMLYYGRVGFDVEVFDATGNAISSSTKSYGTPYVYSSIKETVNGEEKTVYPESYGYRYFYTANIMGVSEEEAVRLNVTPYTMINGVKYKSATTTLDIDFTTGNTDEWKLDKTSIAVKPTGDNVNANFSATDIVAYTNDGALEFNGLDAKFGFAAELDGGVVTVNLTNAFGEVAEKTVLDIYVDNTLTVEGLELPFGHHTLELAKNLTGTHEFVIVKRSGGDYVCINSMGVSGTLTTPPALAKQGVVEVVVEAPASGADYGHVRVYVPTSDESGSYYIRYNFEYLNYALDSRTFDADATNDPSYSSGGGNTPWNCQMYRVRAADLYQKVKGSYVKKFGLLQTGEISVAMKEVVNGTRATDFSGGFHGDENYISLKFLVDGVELDTTTSGTYTGKTTVEFFQDSIIDRCNEPDTPILYHDQHFLVDTNGLRIDRHLEILADNFSPAHDNGYTMMATVYRINTGDGVTGTDDDSLISKKDDPNVASTYNIQTMEILNANGETVKDGSGDAKYDMSESRFTYRSGDEGSTTVPSDKGYEINRYAENYGTKGVYARVGYVIDDASMDTKSTNVQVRLTHGDNKWYACVGSHQTSANGDIVPKGEKWNLSTYYFVDYDSAKIGSSSK